MKYWFVIPLSFVVVVMCYLLFNDLINHVGDESVTNSFYGGLINGTN